MAEAAVPSEPRKKAGKERGIEDYRRKIWKLKKDLEEQRELSLKVQQDELEKLRQSMLKEHEAEMNQLKLETRNDVLQIQTAFSEKEAHISRVLKQKENENKILKQQISGHSGEVTEIKVAIESAHQETVSKLQKENKQLKNLNQELQQKYQTKYQDYRDKVMELKTCQEEFESERQKLLNDALTVKLSRVKREQEGQGNLTKERDLQHKVTELTVALKRLEKRSDALKEENTMLKKAEANNKELEEQCAKLKRRNAELANNVKSAGEKNKQLQVSSRKTSEAVDTGDSLEHAKKLFARQRAKNFAEHNKIVSAKEQEIEKLTKKTLALSDSITNRSRDLTVQNHLDISTALRQSTKEKMILEMSSSGLGGDDSESKATLFNMQADYDSLQDKYTALVEEKEKLEREFEGFRSRLGEVEQELGTERKEKTNLQELFSATEKKCLQLTATNNSVTKERDHLTDTVDKLTEEISVLKHENKSCQRTIEKLNSKNQDLNKSLEVRDNKERQHLELNIETLTGQLQTTKKQLKERGNDLEQLREENSVLSNRVTELLDVKQKLKSQLTELNHSTIPSLEEQSDDLRKMVKQLELKCEDLKEEKEEFTSQQQDHEDIVASLETAKINVLSLTEELDATKEKMEKERKQTTLHKVKLEQEVDRLSSELQHTSEEKTDLEQNRVEAQRRIEVLKNDTRDILASKDEEIENLLKKNEELEHQMLQKHTMISEFEQKLHDAEEQIKALQNDLSRELSNHNLELESFAQLQDKLETTANNLKEAEKGKNQLEIKLEELEAANEKQNLEISDLASAKDTAEEKLVQCENSHLEQLHKFTELSKKLEEQEDELKSKRETTEEFEQSLLAVNSEIDSLVKEKESLEQMVKQKDSENQVFQHQISVLEEDLNKSQNALAISKQLADEAVNNLEVTKQELASLYENKLSKLNDSRQQLQQTNKDLQAQLEEHEGMKQISVYAAENCYHLYIAKFAYDPSFYNDIIDSPLSSPTKSVDRSGADSALSATEKISDISVNPGDYVFVGGEMNEEGFYEGQLLDGRAGLIPSNVLEPLYEFDINGFVVGSVPEDEFETSGKELSEFSSAMFNDSSLLPSTPRPLAPYPRNLTLERQLANGILVGWDAPEGKDVVYIYHVYVDGKVRASLNGKARCKALIEGVKSSITHRVFVTATTSLGESDKWHCTIVIGEPHQPPSELRAIAKDPETAQITFLPHSSNLNHIVYINEEKVRNLGPALFQVDVAGLMPQATYAVTVMACADVDRALTSRDNKSSLSTTISFTMPSIEDFTSINGGELESSFLQNFDKFLDEVSNGSPTPPLKFLSEVDPHMGDADFLRTYDAGFSNNGHIAPKSPPRMLSHSTPKFVNKVLSRKGKIEQYLSPIVLDLDDHAGNNGVTSQPSTPAAHEKSNSESTVTLGTSEATPVISQSNAPRGRDKLSSTEGSSPEKAGDSKPHGKARVSPLQNKSSLQKMIKSLASKEKSRNGVDKRDDEIDSRLSQRQSEKSGERKTRHQRKTEPKARRGNIEVSARQFKALYDYDPAIMSPNKNAENEELPFRAEDVILVFGEADADGFYIGEIGNRRGLVPGNLVIEINVDNELKKGERKMHAAYDYDPKQLSPNKNCEEELSFKQGDTLIVKGDMDEDGFYMGYVAGNKDRTGLVPSNFLRPIANNL